MRIAIVLFFTLITYSVQASQRIVSLAPSITKMLYLLEVQENIVGCTRYCEIAQADQKQVVATAIDVNVEKVFILKPDLVLATTITKQSYIDAMRKLGLKVVVYSTPKSFTGICSQFAEMAQLVGKQILAKQIIDTQKARLEKLQRSIPTAIRPNVFLEIGAKPLFTAIPNTFMDDYITFAGGKNSACDLKSGIITRESVLLKNPDVIVVVTMGIIGSEEKIKWSSYPELRAAKTGKIFIIDSNKACSPTPVSFVDIVEQLISMIYHT